MIVVLLMAGSCYLAITSSDSSPSWNSLIEKSVSMCLSAMHGHSKYLIPSIYQHQYYNCMKYKWIRCRAPQYQVKEFPERMTAASKYILEYTSHWPCLWADSLWQTRMTILYNIEVHRTFQVNLTFTNFILRRTLEGCVYHYITVSGILLNVNIVVEWGRVSSEG